MPLGLIGTLEVAKRGLDANRQGIELTGHNLSNVSNLAYARQRLRIQTSEALPSPTGPIGTGSKVSSIEQVRDRLLDAEIVRENSVSGYLESRQKALEFAEVNLGQQLDDRQASSAEGATASLGIGGQFGIIEGLSDFFNAWQALSTNPNSTADRQIVLLRGGSLTEKFNSVSTRLSNLRDDLNIRVQDEVKLANQLLADISDISMSITSSEIDDVGKANDLRDRRQEKLEALSKYVNMTYSEDTVTNQLNLSIGGVRIISNDSVVDTLKGVADRSTGVERTKVQTAGGTSVKLTKGSIKGVIDARDEEIKTVSDDLDTLARELITQVNTAHSAGIALDGVSTGAVFFSGSNASDIALNTVLKNDPSRIQASSNGEPGNNGVALKLAKMANQTQSALGNLIFSERYNQTVANLGQALNSTNNQMQDQDAVNRMLARQRDSISGVSVDEEMANLIVFQRAFQASARMITTLDELLQSVINLTR
jgi:flagellar hook-associated protein 1 FlgK